MAGLKELKTRRITIVSTKKVTSAMKMIAASKLKKSQDNMIKARPYSSKIKSIIQMLIFAAENFTSEYFVKRPGKRTLYVLISSDKGLCGGFNNNIIKTFRSLSHDAEDIKVIPIGNRICSYLEKNKYDVYAEYRNAFHHFDFNLAANVGRDIIKLYTDNEIDRAVLVFNRFQSAISQTVVKETILPVELEEKSEDAPVLGKSKFVTEPEVDKIFDEIFPRYVNFLIWRGLLESYASENAARMTTMDSATDNSTEMINSLTLQINKERQAKITQEISEIVSGSSAK